jgi:predicted alpha/beta-hydrolase family hydrolase
MRRCLSRNAVAGGAGPPTVAVIWAPGAWGAGGGMDGTALVSVHENWTAAVRMVAGMGQRIA